MSAAPRYIEALVHVVAANLPCLTQLPVMMHSIAVIAVMVLTILTRRQFKAAGYSRGSECASSVCDLVMVPSAGFVLHA